MIPAWTFENPPWNNQFDDCPIQTSMFGDFQWWHWRVLSIAAPKKVPESVKPGWFPTLPHIFPICSPYFPHISSPYLLHAVHIFQHIVPHSFEDSNFSIDLNQAQLVCKGQLPGKGWLCRGRSHHLYPRLRLSTAWKMKRGKCFDVFEQENWGSHL